MFRKDGLKDPQLAKIYSTATMIEAEQAKSLLESSGIPAMLMDSEDSGQYLRILGLGSPFGVDIYVNAKDAERAKQLLEETLSKMEDLTEEELTRLALSAGTEEKEE